MRFFLLVLAAAALYYYLQKRQSQRLWIVPPILSVYGVMLVALLLLTQDWGQFQPDNELIRQFGSWWVANRPDLPLILPHPDMVADSLSFIIPLNAVWLLRERRRKHWHILVLSFVIFGILVLGLSLTSSLSAWLSQLVALIVLGGASLLERFPKIRQLNRNIISAVLIFTLAVGSILGFAGLNVLSRDQTAQASVQNVDSRASLYQNAFALIKEQWLLGGGLGSFPGLYSSYVLILPVPKFFYSHNVYLDVWIEQGVFGLLAWLISAAGTISLSVQSLLRKSDAENNSRLLSAGILASLFALSTHGLIDNPLYAEWGRPLLFVLPGMAVALARGNEFGRKPASTSIQIKIYLVTASIIIALITMGSFSKAVRSAWYANLGAIVMAKSQLAGWPTGQWPEKSMAQQLHRAASYFEESLNLQATNSASNFRLGLISYYGQDFPKAEQYLNNAYLSNNQHRGIQKTLGYTAVWLGQFEQAGSLLSSIPEARDELDVYIWWWADRGRTDLADNARKLIQQIDQERLGAVSGQAK